MKFAKVKILSVRKFHGSSQDFAYTEVSWLKLLNLHGKICHLNRVKWMTLTNGQLFLVQSL